MNGALPPSAANQHGSESTHPNDPTFQVGGVEFAAFRVPDPRVSDKQWWALRVVENGKVFDPRDGSSHEHGSVSNLQASIEDAFARLYENDPDLLRRGYGLPPRLERIRAVCAKARVEVGHYDDPHEKEMGYAERMAWGAAEVFAADAIVVKAHGPSFALYEHRDDNGRVRNFTIDFPLAADVPTLDLNDVDVPNSPIP